jgi:hypothetical protein
VNVMRYTLVDRRGTVSFVASCAALRPLITGCVRGATSVDDLMSRIDRPQRRMAEYVSSGLAIFDEHNVSGNYEAIHEALDHCEPHELPVFRVVDERTRQASLQPVKAGVIVFNLARRRIVQIVNTYAEIKDMPYKMERLSQAGWTVVP